MPCPISGGAPEEIAYIDRQQGWRCRQCKSNLRSIALGREGSLKAVAPALNATTILEINEASDLSSTLRKSPGYVFAAYPEVDMHAMPYADVSFDMVVHSDTLDHVA